MTGGVELFKNDRTDSERLVVAFREFNGFHFLDLRVYIRAAGGEWVPTKKGVAVKLGELWNVSDAIVKACALAAEVTR